MDDAFDAVLATTIFLVVSVYGIQATVASNQPQQVYSGYEQQLAEQIMALIDHNQDWQRQLGGYAYLQYTANSTLVVFNGTIFVLEPPIQLTGQVNLCQISQDAEYNCVQIVLGENPNYESCYVTYTVDDQVVLRVAVCLG
jgi:hypothetical protein